MGSTLQLILLIQTQQNGGKDDDDDHGENREIVHRPVSSPPVKKQQTVNVLMFTDYGILVVKGSSGKYIHGRDFRDASLEFLPLTISTDPIIL